MEACGQLIEFKDAVDVFEFSAVLNQAVAERTRLEILRPSAQTHAAAGVKGVEVAVKFDAIGLEQTTAKLSLNVAFGNKNSSASVKGLAISLEVDRFWRFGRFCKGLTSSADGSLAASISSAKAFTL